MEQVRLSGEMDAEPQRGSGRAFPRSGSCVLSQGDFALGLIARHPMGRFDADG